MNASPADATLKPSATTLKGHSHASAGQVTVVMGSSVHRKVQSQRRPCVSVTERISWVPPLGPPPGGLVPSPASMSQIVTITATTPPFSVTAAQASAGVWIGTAKRSLAPGLSVGSGLHALTQASVLLLLLDPLQGQMCTRCPPALTYSLLRVGRSSMSLWRATP